MLKYSIIIEPQKEGGFVISIPSLPGCATQGETLEECLENIDDAAKGYLHVLYKNKQSIPMESHFESITINPKELLHA